MALTVFGGGGYSPVVGEVFWRTAAAVTATVGKNSGGFGGVGFCAQATQNLGRPEVSLLDDLVLLLVSILGEAAVDFWWQQRVVHMSRQAAVSALANFELLVPISGEADHGSWKTSCLGGLFLANISHGGSVRGGFVVQ